MPIKLYGNVGIVADGEERPAGRARERAILAYLSTHPNATVSADTLLDAFWDDDSDRARRSLQVRIANLRRQLAGSGAELESVPGGYRLVVDLDDIDVERFARMVAAARAATGGRRLQILEDARSIRTERPLVEFAYEDFAVAAARADDECHREATALEAESLLDAGSPSAAVSVVTPVLTEHPHDERLAATAMRALAASGRVTEALDTYGRLADALAERGLEPGPELVAIEEAVVLGTYGTSSDLPSPPPEPSLIGRAEVLAETLELIAAHRFVTVVGPPGVGKTSLAAVAAHELMRRGSPVAWVGLTGTRPGDVPQKLARTLGVTGSTSMTALVDALDRPSQVLMLDNCEAAAPTVEGIVRRLVDRLPGLRVLATSRVALGDEQRVGLEPLPTPSPDADRRTIDTSPAVQVFVERARAIDSRFRADDHLESIADVVRAVDGLPLAIELAATRTVVLTPEQILERLGDRFALLRRTGDTSPEHHRTLRQTLQWSIDLLSDDATRLLARLSVFRGGFSLDGAEAIGGGEVQAPLDALQELVLHSLVQPDPQRSRYRMLASVAEAAADLLDPDAHQEADEAHRRFVSSLTEAVATGSSPEEIRDACDRLDGDGDNLRVALARCLDSEPHEAARLLAQSWRWWHVRGFWTEGAAVARHLLSHSVPADRDLRRRLLDASVRLMVFGGEHDELPWVLDLLDDLDGLAGEMDLPPLLGVRGLALRMSGEWASAAAAHEREVEQLRARGLTARAALANLAAVRVLLGDLGGAREAAREAIDDAVEHGEGDVDTTPVTLAEIELLEGNYERARNIAETWLEHARLRSLEAGFRAEALQTASIARLRAGDPDGAAPLLSDLLPLSVALGGTHFGMALLAVALAALDAGRIEDAAALGATAAEDRDLALRPHLAAIAHEADAATEREGLPRPAGPLARADAVRLARDVIAALGRRADRL